MVTQLNEYQKDIEQELKHYKTKKHKAENKIVNEKFIKEIKE